MQQRRRLRRRSLRGAPRPRERRTLREKCTDVGGGASQPSATAGSSDGSRARAQQSRCRRGFGTAGSGRRSHSARSAARPRARAADCGIREERGRRRGGRTRADGTPSAERIAASTGLSVEPAASVRASPAATSSPPACTGGTKRTIAASTVGCPASRSRQDALECLRRRAPGRACRPDWRRSPRPRSASRNAGPPSPARATGSSSPADSHASARRMPRPPAFVSRADAAPARQRLRREQRRDVEQLLERLGPGSRRPDERARRQRRPIQQVLPCESSRRDGPRAVVPLFSARIGLRLATRRASRANLRGLPNDSRYSSTRGPSRLVFLPPLQQVVGRDVRLVADRHERREDRGRGRRRLLEQRGNANAPLCDEKPMVAGRNRSRRERGVQHSAESDSDPETVRSEQTYAMGAHEREQLLLPGTALSTQLREAGRDDAERANPRTQRLLRGGKHVLSRQAQGRAGRSRRGSPRSRRTSGRRRRALLSCSRDMRRRRTRRRARCERGSPPIVPRRAGRHRRPRRRAGGRKGRSDATTATWSRESTVGDIVAGSAAIGKAISTVPSGRSRARPRGRLPAKTFSIATLPGSTSATKRSIPDARPPARSDARAGACRYRAPARRRRPRRPPPLSARVAEAHPVSERDDPVFAPRRSARRARRSPGRGTTRGAPQGELVHGERSVKAVVETLTRERPEEVRERGNQVDGAREPGAATCARRGG